MTQQIPYTIATLGFTENERIALREAFRVTEHCAPTFRALVKDARALPHVVIVNADHAEAVAKFENFRRASEGKGKLSTLMWSSKPGSSKYTLERGASLSQLFAVLERMVAEEHGFAKASAPQSLFVLSAGEKRSGPAAVAAPARLPAVAVAAPSTAPAPAPVSTQPAAVPAPSATPAAAATVEAASTAATPAATAVGTQAATPEKSTGSAAVAASAPPAAPALAQSTSDTVHISTWVTPPSSEIKPEAAPPPAQSAPVEPQPPAPAPQSEEIAVVLEPPAPVPVQIPTRPGPGAGARFLVVDDSLPVRIQMKEALKGFAKTIDFAHSGEEAMFLIDNCKYDVIFLDVILPGKDGYEVCRYIRGHTLQRQTPVIMLTGNSSPADRVKGKLAGCDTYLIKPVRASVLAELIGTFTKSSAVA